MGTSKRCDGPTAERLKEAGRTGSASATMGSLDYAAGNRGTNDLIGNMTFKVHFTQTNVSACD